MSFESCRDCEIKYKTHSASSKTDMCGGKYFATHYANVTTTSKGHPRQGREIYSINNGLICGP